MRSLLLVGARPLAACTRAALTRGFSGTSMLLASALETELTAPNGTRWTQPLGLFIDNEFVTSPGEGEITTVNP